MSRMTLGRMASNGMGLGHNHDDRYTPAVEVPVGVPIAFVPGRAYLVEAEMWAVSADKVDHALFRGTFVVFVTDAEADATISPGEIWVPYTDTAASEVWIPDVVPAPSGITLTTSAPEGATVAARLFYRPVGDL